MERLLLVDDNITFLKDAKAILETRFEVIEASSGKQAIALLRKNKVSAALLDYKMPDMNGIEVMNQIHSEIDDHLPVIIITNHGDVETAVLAMREGAYDFISKEFDLNILSAKIFKALERRNIEIQNEILQSAVNEARDDFVFRSERMRKINQEIDNFAKHDSSVLLIGETGVGKDVIANEIHRRSSRSDKPFLTLSLGETSSTLIESDLFGHVKGAFTGATKDRVGKFEAADGGTVYLPEISTLSTDLQIKLLRFLEQKTIARVGQDASQPMKKLNVRLIFATNEDLKALVEAGKMRSDFYFRINIGQLVVPPLRERIEDIDALVEYFMKKEGKPDLKVSRDALQVLKGYEWPGNVRELKNLISNVTMRVHDEELRPEHFMMWLSEPNNDKRSFGRKILETSKLPRWSEAERAFQEEYFREVLKRTRGNITRASRIAGMTTQGFRRVIRKLNPSDD
ncbi:MAG: sigma-54-dependent transcriptional regulator [Candidatus Kryptoniota bacterium]